MRDSNYLRWIIAVVSKLAIGWFPWPPDFSWKRETPLREVRHYLSRRRRPPYTRRQHAVVLLLDQLYRWWPNSKTALFQHLSTLKRKPYLPFSFLPYCGFSGNMNTTFKRPTNCLFLEVFFMHMISCFSVILKHKRVHKYIFVWIWQFHQQCQISMNEIFEGVMQHLYLNLKKGERWMFGA